eukprot:CAMPEP_0182470938 /NCGR_PEP_ID=MMETSP1319-20130603/19499_1 /TAXON_ID=172717 /ORGANISM="Bolidomonas pacifica, Strain RCC208" /LENGTH=224 /DNA_ID=CAMNT_0024671443 /DNA_START=172 /DNA_END=843 /DNA_ORIENTATION=-
MKFRPCIDLHAGSVKQIVGSSLSDGPSSEAALSTNFTSSRPASYYANMYKSDGLKGGHVIMLGGGNQEQAEEAIKAYPNGLQIGGGITASNAPHWISLGASHVIVTSYAFSSGRVDYGALSSLASALGGKERVVLDLSCRRRPGDEAGPYYVVTDRWQTYTDVVVDGPGLQALALYCDEFLVHGVENEGRRCGILEDLVRILAESPVPVTYAGGVRGMDDVERV